MLRRLQWNRKTNRELTFDFKVGAYLVLRDSSLRATVFSRAIVFARIPWNLG
jgi:hypothetical protein